MDFQSEVADRRESLQDELSSPNGVRPSRGFSGWPNAKIVYALRASAVLARAYPDQLLKAADIGAEAAVPLRFLFKILGELRDAGLVVAKRGHYGGYALSRPPREVHVDEICRAVDSREMFEPIESPRTDGSPWGLDLIWVEIRTFAIERLRRATVDELCTSDTVVRP